MKNIIHIDEPFKKIVAFIGYAAFISAMFIVMPDNPDEISAPMELVNGFRIMSIFAVSIFWISVGILLGVFWEKFQPHFSIQKEQKSTTY